MKPLCTPLIGLFAIVLGLNFTGAASAADWATIAGPSQAPANPGTPANVPDKVVWGSDLAGALAQARKENRPLFVTLRCIPCKQCSAFDKDVLEGGPDLDPLLKQFITVRLIDAKAADLRVLPMAGFQDMDLSWWGYFLSPEGKIYGIYGGRDEVSDTTRISKAGLVNTLKRVLAYHNDPRRAAWDIDGPAPDFSAPAQTIADLPGYPSWKQQARIDQRSAQAGCIHCHQASEIMREPALTAKTFNKDRDLQIWPFPENVGVKLDRDDGLKVTAVTPGSPAEKAGIHAGDSLAAAGADGSMRKLFGQCDFRGVLHRARSNSIDVWFIHDGKPTEAHLALADGWRKTALGWRRSVSQGNIGCGPGFFPLPASAADRKNLGVGPDEMLVKAFYPNGSAKAAGLKQNDFIVAVDGEKPNVDANPFNVWFRLHHDVGDAVTLTIARAGGQRETISYKAAPWSK